MMTINEYLANNFRNFDTDYLRRKYLEKVSAGGGINIDTDEHLIQINIDPNTLKILPDGKLSVIQTEALATDGEYFCSDEAQGVLIHYYDYDFDDKAFKVFDTDICVNAIDTKFYKYGFTVKGSARILVKVNGKFYICSSGGGANEVNKDVSNRLEYKDQEIHLDGTKLEVELIENHLISSEEVFPVEETNW